MGDDEENVSRTTWKGIISGTVFEVKWVKTCDKRRNASNENRVESVPFFFQKEILEEVNHPSLQNQVATVQYNGVKNHMGLSEVTGVTLRLYVAPLSAIGIDDILETFKAYRSELKGTPKFSLLQLCFC